MKELTACDLTEDSHALYLAPLIVNSSAESTAGAPPRRTCISLDWTKQTASDRLTQFSQLESVRELPANGRNRRHNGHLLQRNASGAP